MAKALYDDMARMEELLHGSDRDWTIVRPAGLFAADQVSPYRLTSGHEPGVFTSMVDLADALLGEACVEQPHPSGTVEVLTDTSTPRCSP